MAELMMGILTIPGWRGSGIVPITNEIKRLAERIIRLTMNLLLRFAGELRRMLLLTLLAGVACALLVHFAPGSQIDERELDLRLNQQSIAVLRAQRARQNDLSAVFARYMRQVSKGDLGFSTSKNAPVWELIKDNAPATANELFFGLLGSWLVGVALAIPLGSSPAASFWDATTSVTAGLLLSLPAALLAYLCLSEGTGVELVFVLALTPRIFRIAKNVFRDAYGLAHVQMARAWGLSEFRIFFQHVLPASGSPLLALAATSVAMALGAAIPIETICDVAGLGRLAWQAALARDLFLLVNLTMLIAIATTAAMAVAAALTKSQQALTQEPAR